MRNFLRCSFLGFMSMLLAACDQSGLAALKSSLPMSIISNSGAESSESPRQILELVDLIDTSAVKVDVEAGFSQAMGRALSQDPAVISAKNQLEGSKANLRMTESARDTQISATVLGGVEDITDETAGVAAILTANRMLYDGGKLNAKIDADLFNAKAAEQAYLAMRSERAMRLAYSWIELERYQGLEVLINTRLAVLDPLLVQLERVVSAGVGDVSQVAAAQRVVSMILVAEADVSGKYQQAKIAFVNGFGQLPVEARYDASMVSKGVSSSTSKKLLGNSPGLMTKYWAYRAAEASVVAVKAQNDFNIDLKVKFQRPFGGSDANSDESIGFALTKNLYQGDQLESQIKRAVDTARAKSAEILTVYQDGEMALLAAREMIKTMDRAIEIARRNAKSSREEIKYLKKQLVIGGSTLESVLSAEAQLYDAESKEISFIAERRKAEVKIVALTGVFTRILGL